MRVFKANDEIQIKKEFQHLYPHLKGISLRFVRIGYGPYKNYIWVRNKAKRDCVLKHTVERIGDQK